MSTAVFGVDSSATTLNERERLAALETCNTTLSKPLSELIDFARDGVAGPVRRGVAGYVLRLSVGSERDSLDFMAIFEAIGSQVVPMIICGDKGGAYTRGDIVTRAIRLFVSGLCLMGGVKGGEMKQVQCTTDFEISARSFLGLDAKSNREDIACEDAFEELRAMKGCVTEQVSVARQGVRGASLTLAIDTHTHTHTHTQTQLDSKHSISEVISSDNFKKLRWSTKTHYLLTSYGTTLLTTPQQFSRKSVEEYVGEVCADAGEEFSKKVVFGCLNEWKDRVDGKGLTFTREEGELVWAIEGMK